MVQLTEWVLRGQVINTTVGIDGGETVILTIRDKDGARIEKSTYGPLELHVGGAVLSSDGGRADIEARYGYSADRTALDSPGGQDAGVWVWTAPEGACGHVKIAGDWLDQFGGGVAELMVEPRT